jgi:glycosyltransferase involved in cell wall biosynthesis
MSDLRAPTGERTAAPRRLRVLIVHNEYQQPGGEDEVAQREKHLLLEAGHVVSEYRRRNAEISEYGLLEKAALPFRTVWAADSCRELRRLLRNFRPDIVHFHNTLPLISPAAYWACAEEGVGVVKTLHNYLLLCPCGLLERDGRPCEECLPSSLKWRGVLHACYRKSRMATATVSAMLAVHNVLGTWRDKVTQYIAPSEFSRGKFISSGLPAAKITVKPNFVSPDPQIRAGEGDSALFVGRFSAAKGIDVLLKAWSMIGRAIPLRVVGDGPLRPELERQKTALELGNVSFEGTLPNASVLAAMKQARFLVFPSIWYENFPVVLCEAYACGVPVVASRLGAAGEIVRDDVTGLHFAPGDPEDLASKVEWAWSHPERMREMGKAARAEYESKYTAEQNYKILMAIYERALCRSGELAGPSPNALRVPD